MAAHDAVEPSTAVSVQLSVKDGRCSCAVTVRSHLALPQPAGMRQHAPAVAPQLVAMDSEEVGLECAICMRSLAFSCVGGACTHHFCAACIIQFCASVRDGGEDVRPDCPKCRAPFKCLLLDPEYDALCGAATRRPADLAPYTLVLRLGRDEHAGITLRSTNSKIGVVAERVNRRDAAYAAGVRAGDVLIWLNGAPCRSHAGTVKQIDKAKESGVAITLVLLPRPRERQSHGTVHRAASSEEEPAGVTQNRGAHASFAVRLVDEVAWRQASPGVIIYTLAFSDASADGQRWQVSRRYSSWRRLLECVHARWPHALLEPTPLDFPPKALPAFLLRASPAMMQGVLAGRAAGLEAFVSELIERARSNEASGLGEWLQHWLRSSADGGTMVTREEVVA